jgi:hypothetical protein
MKAKIMGVVGRVVELKRVGNRHVGSRPTRACSTASAATRGAMQPTLHDSSEGAGSDD